MTEDTTNLRDFLTVLFKHKTKIVAIFLATVITVTIGTFLMSPVYEAKSTLLVKIGRENIYRPEVGDRSPMISMNQEEVVNSEINILTSQDLIEKVITDLKIENIYPEVLKSSWLEDIGLRKKTNPMQAAVLNFKKKLTAQGMRKSSVIEISFQHKNPQIAAKAVNMLTDLYKEKHLAVYGNPQSSFLEKQLSAYDQKLKQSENDLETFKQKNKVYSLDEQRSLLLKQGMELDTNLKNTNNSIEELRKRLFSLKSQMNAISEDKEQYTQTERDKIIVEARSRLLALELKEKELLSKYKEDSRIVTNVRKEIELVTNFLRQQEADITRKVKTGNVIYQEAEKEALKTEADLQAQLAKYEALRRQLNQVNGEIQSMDLKGKELVNLKRESTINDKNYIAYAEKLDEARISDDMNRQKMANVSVIQPAAVPANPIKPKKMLNIVLGILLGAVSGLGFAFFCEFNSQAISTPETLEKKLGLPVLTTVAFKKQLQ